MIDPGGRAPKRSVATTSYAAPQVVRFEGQGATGAPTRGGVTVTIVGIDFGEHSSSIDGVRYGDFGEPEFDVTPTCSMLVPHTRIVCTTTEGAAGATIRWVVTVDGQDSVAPSTSAAAPVVEAVECFDASTGESLTHASVSGGTGLRVRGQHFATSVRRIDWVRYGVAGAELEARDCDVVEAHEVIECVTPPGGGRELPLTVSIRDQRNPSSSRSFTITHETPRIDAVAEVRGNGHTRHASPAHDEG